MEHLNVHPEEDYDYFEFSESSRLASGYLDDDHLSGNIITRNIHSSLHFWIWNIYCEVIISEAGDSSKLKFSL